MSAVQRLLTAGSLAVGAAVVVGVGLVVPAAPVPLPTAGAELDARTTNVCSAADDDARQAELVAAGVGAGKLTIGELGGAEVAGLSSTGAVARTVGPKPYQLTATSALAAASAGALLASNGTDADRGLAAQPCLQAATDHWFVGLGAKAPQLSTLLVTNPDAQAAEVELRVTGPRGAVTAPGSSGIAIPPRSTRAIPLEGMVDAEGALAVQVRATAGRVRVIAQDRHRDGVNPAGADWVAPTAAPSTRFVISGIAGGTGSRDLVLVNPGERTATVKVEALAADGAFALEGADAIDVPPSSTVRVPLAKPLDGEAVGLRITSDGAVAGAVVMATAVDQLAPDTAVAVASPAVIRTVVLPLLATTDVAGQLQVSNAADVDAAATVVVTDRSGREVDRKELTVPAGGTVALALSGNGLWGQVLTDGTDVHAAVVLTATRDSVAGLAWLPGVSSRVGTPVPQVRIEPRLGW